MIKYANLSKKSGVAKFAISDNYIKIQFINSSTVYKYSHRKPGKQHVEKMKELAVAGLGLATYISKNIKDNYHSKI